MKKLVVLWGAGISAESGIRTFRDAAAYGSRFKWKTLPARKDG